MREKRKERERERDGGRRGGRREKEGEIALDALLKIGQGIRSRENLGAILSET